MSAMFSRTYLPLTPKLKLSDNTLAKERPINKLFTENSCPVPNG
jgi:hypothetical protein